MSGSSSRIERRPRRTMAWSSTSITRAGDTGGSVDIGDLVQRHLHAQADPPAAPATHGSGPAQLPNPTGDARQAEVGHLRGGRLQPPPEDMGVPGAVLGHRESN